MKRFYIFILALLIIITFWSFLGQKDKVIWFLEGFPAIIFILLSLLSYRYLRLTSVSYVIVGLHCIILLVGARYTYAEVPLFNWFQEVFDLSRNHYDRVGHFFQGLTPAIVGRELLLRTSPLKRGKWLVAILLLVSLGVSASYEVLEWAVGSAGGETAEAFLGLQGDMWDTQKDMFMAFVGALFSVTILARFQDKELLEMPH